MASPTNVYGLNSGNVPAGASYIPFLATYSPSSTNTVGPYGAFKIGQEWINTATSQIYVLTSINSSQGSTNAVWTFLSPTTSGLQQLTGNTGTAVPTLGSIQIAGTNHVITAAAGSTVTASLDSQVVALINGDSGSTTGQGNGITIHGQGSVVTGAGTPAGYINILGRGVTSVPTQSGTATVASNAIQILGTGTVSTSAAGNVVTITATGGAGNTWVTVHNSSITFAINTNYYLSCTTPETFILPVGAVTGTIVELSNISTGTAKITITGQAGQSIALPGITPNNSVNTMVSYAGLFLVYNATTLTWYAMSVVGQWAAGT